MKCPKCGYEWRERVDNPKRCPRCGYFLIPKEGEKVVERFKFEFELNDKQLKGLAKVAKKENISVEELIRRDFEDVIDEIVLNAELIAD